MGLRAPLLRFAARHPHVLPANLPGGTAARLAVERLVRLRGWPLAGSPADADLLLVTGVLDARSEPLVDHLWGQLPCPRVRAHIRAPDGVEAAVESARQRLAEGGETPASGAGAQGGGHQDSADGGHGGHGEHSGHGDGMGMPGGLATAERGADRDGLALDRLHVPFGPLLPGWPPGLVVRATLQGDVVQEARVELLGADGPPDGFWVAPWRRAGAGEAVSNGAAARRLVAARLDSLVGFLRVAGWTSAATRAGRLRDEVLAGVPAARAVPGLRRLARLLRRSRTLRWLTDGLGVLPPDRVEAAGIGGSAARASRTGGDVTARWLAWLEDVEAALPELDDTAPLRAGATPPGGIPHLVPTLAVLRELLEGVELAQLRLIVASFDPDPAKSARAGSTGVSGG